LHAAYTNERPGAFKGSRQPTTTTKKFREAGAIGGF
jgi:hypothetical protein